MVIHLYKDFQKKVNSTRQPSDFTPTSLNVVLKKSTNLINPVFILTIDCAEYNYVFVPDWGRCYFVSDVVYGNDNLCELHCTFDSLATYRENILTYDAFVERTSNPNYYNPDINDSALSVEDMVEYTAEASTACGIADDLIYIVRVMGRGSTGGIGSFVVNRFQLQNMFSALWGQIDSGSVTDAIVEFLQLYISNPAQYIVGVYSTPLGASVYADHVSDAVMYVGGHETNITQSKITSGSATVRTGLVLNKPSIRYTDFRRTDGAFSQYSIYIPTVGNCPLSPDIMDCTLTMDISADLYSGDLFFALKADGAQVATYTSNCYSSVSLGVLNSAQSAFVGASQVMAGAMTANPVGVIEGIKTGFSPTPSIIGTQGGTGCIPQHNEIVISVLQKSSADSPSAVCGRPCCKMLGLRNLLGSYVKCGNPSIELAGTDRDKEEVNRLLSAGIYLE